MLASQRLGSALICARSKQEGKLYGANVKTGTRLGKDLEPTLR